MKRILTTGNVARLCHVTINTVVKWAETGELKYFKIPRSGARRFKQEDVIEFMSKHGFPMKEVLDRKTKILIVDDEPAIRKLFKEAFPSSEGYEVLGAASIFEAGLLVSRTAPDMIFLDTVGIAGGYEVCRLIKEDASRANVKVIAISGAISGMAPGQILKQGFDNYLRKPFSIKKLRKLVASYSR